MTLDDATRAAMTNAAIPTITANAALDAVTVETIEAAAIAVLTTGRSAMTGVKKDAYSDDAAAWAAGEWAIVRGPRKPAKSAHSHETRVLKAHVRKTAWAVGEWAMPDADASSNEELD
jgi:hypothetical protein